MLLTAILNSFLGIAGGAEELWLLLPALLAGRWLGEVWWLPVDRFMEFSGVIGSVHGVPLNWNTNLAGWHTGPVPHNCFFMMPWTMSL